MSQRGGSVVTHVKIAPEVASPIVGLGDADVILAFEELEALRYINYLKEGGTVLVNTQRILPMPVITGARKYPENILSELKARAGRVYALDAAAEAEAAGSLKSVNVVMIGALAKVLGVDIADAEAALKAAVKPKFYDINRIALGRGYACDCEEKI